jgi:hypothetical protein
MNKNSNGIAHAFGLAISLLVAGSACMAQISTFAELNGQVNGAKQALAELDDKALTCTSSFNLNLGEATALLCDEFMRAVDGEILANYLERCGTLKAWRDSFVESNHDSIPDLEADEALKMMMAVQYTCGENALQKRTNYVVDAFNTLVKGTLLNKTSTQSFDLRISELELQNRMDRERRALQDAINAQREQREQATQNQFRSIENELIRQQINN